ncbi:MAG: hypothetical protein ACRET8_10940 [Burkholderiales bacterium]
MKIILALAIVAGLAGWFYRDRLSPAAHKQAAAGPGNRPSLQHLSDDEYSRQLQENVALRVKLSKQYPDSYKRLALQVRRNLRECIVTEVVPGVLKAVCH